MSCLDRSIGAESEEVKELRVQLKSVVHLLEDESLGLHEVLILCNRLLVIRQKIEKIDLQIQVSLGDHIVDF